MSTYTKKPTGVRGRGPVDYKKVARDVTREISLAHIDPPIFSSAVADPTNADWQARYDCDVKLGDIYYDSNASYQPKVCTVVGSSPTWAAIGSVAALTLQGAFANGKVISGATSAANAMQVGGSNDKILLYEEASNDVRITTTAGADLTIAPNDDLVLAPTGGDVTLTGTLDVSSTFTVATNKLSVNATTGTVTSTGNYVTSNTADENAFAVPANGSKFKVNASTGTVTIAGDCAVTGNITGTFTGTFSGTWSSSTWNANPTITVSATTGQGLTVDGRTVTSGDIVYLICDSSLTGGGGYFLRGYNTTTAATAFSIASDGTLTIAGTAGSNSLVVSAGAISVTGSEAISGRASNDNLLALTRSNSATGGSAISVAMGSATVAGHGLAITWGGAGTGDAINIDMTNNVAGGALVLTGAGSRTDSLIDIVDVPASGANTITISATAAHNSGHVIDISDTGAYSNNVINIAYSGNNATGDAIAIAMTAAAATANAISITGKSAATVPLVTMTAAGGAAGDAIYIASTAGNAAARALHIYEHGTSTNEIIKVYTDTTYGGDALLIDLTGSAAGAQAIVITDNARGANATAPTVSLTTATGNAGYALSVANTSSHNSGHVVYLSESGTTSHNVIGCVLGGAFTGDVLNIAMANGGAASQAIVVTSNVAHSGNLVSVAATGNLAGGTGKVASLTYATGTLASATSGFLLDIADTSGARATSYCVQISSTDNEALYVSSGVVKITEAISADGGVTAAGRITTTDGVASGTAKVVGGRASAAVASGTTHTNTTDETVLGSFTIKANTIKQGTVVKVLFGIITPSTNAADTYTVRLRLGPTTLVGTALITTSAVDVANNDVVVGSFQLVGRAAPGAAAECVGCGMYSNPAAYGAGVGGAMLTAYLAETNFATNGDLLLEVTGDWSAANAADQAHLDYMYVEIV
jgi:hypothetical protein